MVVALLRMLGDLLRRSTPSTATPSGSTPQTDSSKLAGSAASARGETMDTGDAERHGQGQTDEQVRRVCVALLAVIDDL